MSKELPDVQAALDLRGISINRVGIENVSFPFTISRREGGTQAVESNVNMYASLFHKVKGTNMSRFTEVLMEYANSPLSGKSFKHLLERLKQHVGADDVYVSALFKYFLRKRTPVTGKESVLGYDCGFKGILRESIYHFFLEVRVPITTLCPCSKAMSAVDKNMGRGAHNQKGLVTVQLEATRPPYPWLETLIHAVERCGSSEIYPLLKREDEKFVTEQAYNNPKFVEDVVRDAALEMQKIRRINWFKVKAVSFESIHDHSAVAYVTRQKIGGKWRKAEGSFL